MTNVERGAEEIKYPDLVCDQCGSHASGNHYAAKINWTDGVCDVCKKSRKVTTPDSFCSPYFFQLHDKTDYFKEYDIVEYTPKTPECSSTDHGDGWVSFSMPSYSSYKNGDKKQLGMIKTVNDNRANGWGVSYSIDWLDGDCPLHNAWWTHCGLFRKVGERKIVLDK